MESLVQLRIAHVQTQSRAVTTRGTSGTHRKARGVCICSQFSLVRLNLQGGQRRILRRLGLVRLTLHAAFPREHKERVHHLHCPYAEGVLRAGVSGGIRRQRDELGAVDREGLEGEGRDKQAEGTHDIPGPEPRRSTHRVRHEQGIKHRTYPFAVQRLMDGATKTARNTIWQEPQGQGLKMLVAGSIPWSDCDAVE